MRQKKVSEDYHSFLRLALPLMSKYNIPVTPQNYAVWFTYVSGANESLRMTIDRMIERGENFNEEINQMLYRRFGLGIDESEIRKLRDDLKQLLLTILDQVMMFCGRTDNFETTLHKSVEQLSGEVTIQEIKAIVDQIISETRSVGGAGKSMHQNLEEKSKELDTLRKEFENARKEALRDFLTGTANRKAFDEAIVRMTYDAAMIDKPLCLLLIDIDLFKKFNDEFGHIIGDEVIKFVASKIIELVRGRDLVARFGGEEFAVLLPQTDIKGAAAVAENLRKYFSLAKLKTASNDRVLGHITVSIGAACYRPGEPLEAFIERADRALYHSKNSGRNRVALETELSPGA